MLRPKINSIFGKSPYENRKKKGGGSNFIKLKKGGAFSKGEKWIYRTYLHQKSVLAEDLWFTLKKRSKIKILFYLAPSRV